MWINVHEAASTRSVEALVENIGLRKPRRATGALLPAGGRATRRDGTLVSSCENPHF